MEVLDSDKVVSVQQMQVFWSSFSIAKHNFLDHLHLTVHSAISELVGS